MENNIVDIRATREWNNIFKLIKNKKYAPLIIEALPSIKKYIKLNKREYNSVHIAYDNKLLFEALGYSIQGEDTPGTKEFTDIIFKYWDILSIYLNKEIRDLVYHGYIDS